MEVEVSSRATRLDAEALCGKVGRLDKQLDSLFVNIDKVVAFSTSGYHVRQLWALDWVEQLDAILALYFADNFPVVQYEVTY